MHTSNIRFVAIALLLLALAGISHSGNDLTAAEKPSDSKGTGPAALPSKADEPAVVKLVLHPAKPPAAALEFSLVPRFIEQAPGNAALLYLKAESLHATWKAPDKFWDQVSEWLETPPSKLPRDEVHKQLASFEGIFKLLRQGARRDRCDWDPPIHEDNDPYGILLPEMQDLRNLGRLLALKARLQIAEGHVAEALDTLQTGYALARHASDCPFLVCGLIGIVIAGQMDDEVEALLQTPNCPNLYWSLTALPDPIVDLRPAMNVEADTIFLEFPELRGVEQGQHSTEEWNLMLARVNQRWAKISPLWAIGGPSSSNLGATLVTSAEEMARLGQARADLAAAGLNRESVDAMPAAQVILIHAAVKYRQGRDEIFKWFNVPYWQSRAGLDDADKSLGSTFRAQEIVPLASALVPAIKSVSKASVRSQRRIALLRVIEALRFYAADHHGKLPATLDDIKEVPLPVDPVTGQPFGYKLNEGAATLDAPPPTGETWLALGVRYEITMAAK